MSGQRFTAKERFYWHGTVYEVERVLSNRQIIIRDTETDACHTLDQTELVEAIFEGGLSFVQRSSEYDLQGDAPGRSRIRGRALDDYPEELVAVARWRLSVIQPLLALEDPTEEAVRAHVAEIKNMLQGGDKSKGLRYAISRPSVYRWIRDYQKSGDDLRALIPGTHRRGGKGKSRLAPAVETIIRTTIQDKVYRREETTIADVHHEVAVRIKEENALRGEENQLTVPSRSTIARRIDRQDLRKRFAARHGKRAARQAFTQYDQMERVERPLERVEIDHTQIDLIVVDGDDRLPLGRLTITATIDVATRFPHGLYLGFEPPGYLPVMECLYHGIRPKGDVCAKYGTVHEWPVYGIPDELVIDNGKEFIGRDLEDACQLLDIKLHGTPIRTPHLKPFVERYFRTLNAGLFHTLEGTTFSNLAQRGDYDSLKKACLTLEEVEWIMHKYLLDIYAEDFHEGLDGIPARRWEALTQEGFAPRIPGDAQELLILLGRVGQRVIHPYGIDFKRIRYNQADLYDLRHRLKGAKVKFKYHPGDLSRIHVYDPFEKEYIEVPALDQDYTQGLSLWRHEVIRRYVNQTRKEVDIAALGEAKREIQERVQASKAKASQVRTRSKVGRYQDVPPSLRRREWKEEPAGDEQLPEDENTSLEAAPAVELDDETLLALDLQPDEGWGILAPDGRKTIYKKQEVNKEGDDE